MPPDLDTTVADLAAPAPASPEPAVPATEAPAAPAGPAPSLKDVMRATVAEQKERAADPSKPKPTHEAIVQRARAPDGKFAGAVDKPAPDRTVKAPDAAAAPPTPAAPGAQTPPDPAAPAMRPPPGWSPQSKVDFDKLPDHIKADIAKREVEVDKGFAKLAAYRPVDKYFDMAVKGGTTLDRALEQYVGIEQLLRRDVFAGVEQVLKNVGINDLTRFAQAVLARQGGQQPGQASPPVRQPTVDPSAIVRQSLDAVRAEFQTREVASEIQRFAADPQNRFYENVKSTMGQLIQSGIAVGDTPREQLQDAYAKACRLDPTIATLINQPAQPDPNGARSAAAAQARAAAKATTGAPATGFKPEEGGLPRGLPLREVIRRTAAAQQGRT